MASPAIGGGNPKMPKQPKYKIQPVVPGKKPKPSKDKPYPMPKITPDDKVIRTMPITEKQLGQIKKMYGIK